MPPSPAAATTCLPLPACLLLLRLQKRAPKQKKTDPVVHKKEVGRSSMPAMPAHRPPAPRRRPCVP